MKRLLIICLLFVLITALIGCEEKKCMYCESTDVKYEAIFSGTGGHYYLCEICYEECNKNPTFDDIWKVSHL